MLAFIFFLLIASVQSDVIEIKGKKYALHPDGAYRVIPAGTESCHNMVKVSEKISCLLNLKLSEEVFVKEVKNLFIGEMSGSEVGHGLFTYGNELKNAIYSMIDGSVTTDLYKGDNTVILIPRGVDLTSVPKYTGKIDFNSVNRNVYKIGNSLSGSLNDCEKFKKTIASIPTHNNNIIVFVEGVECDREIKGYTIMTNSGSIKNVNGKRHLVNDSKDF